MKFFVSLLLSMFITSGLLAKEEPIVMTPDNTVVLRGVINAQLAAKFVKEFQELMVREDVKKIYVYVLSPGGAIFAGDIITNILDSSTKEVVMVVEFAASMAFHTVSHGQKKLMTSTGTMMQHHASGGFEGQFPNMDSEFNWIKRKVEEMNRYDAASCKKVSYSQFMKNIDRDWWLLTEEALKAGCIDGVAQKVSCSKELSNGVVKETIEFFGMKIKLEWSGCPLENYPRNITMISGKEVTPKQQLLFEELILVTTDPLTYYKKYGSFNYEKFVK